MRFLLACSDSFEPVTPREDAWLAIAPFGGAGSALGPGVDRAPAGSLVAIRCVALCRLFCA